MSLEFVFDAMCTTHIGIGFSGVPKRRMNFTEKPRVSSSPWTSSTGISFGMPFRTTLRERSSGSENVWNSVPLDISVLWIRRNWDESEVWMVTWLLEDDLAVRDLGARFGRA